MINTLPDDGRSSPASSASSVDLPLPDGPMMAANCPGGMAKLTSFSTVIVFDAERNRRVRPRVSMVGISGCMAIAWPII